MAVTTTSAVDPEVQKYFDMVLLDRRKRFNVHLLFGQQRRIPMKNSRTLTLRRYNPLDDTPAPAVEGVTPAYESVSKFDIDIQLQQYVKAVALSDRVVIEVQDETAEEVADMLNQNMFEMLDKVTRNTLDSSASQIDCANGVNGGSPTEISQTDLDLALDYLHGNNAVKLAPDMEGASLDGTTPIEAAFWGICHTDIRKDVRALDSFVPPASYGGSGAKLQSELGSTDEVRWVMSSAAAVTSGTYSNFIMGANAYGLCDIDEVAAEMILKPLGAGEDPANQRQTMAWKAMFGAGILDDGWVLNLRSTKSA